MLSNLKIGVRLGLGFGFILSLLLLIAGAGLNRMGAIAGDTENIVLHYNKQLELANQMSEQVYLITRMVRTVFIWDSVAERKADVERIGQARERYNEKTRELEQTLNSDASKSLFAEIQANLVKYRAANTRILNALLEKRDSEAARILSDEVRPVEKAYQDSLARLVEHFTGSIQKRYEQAQASHRQAVVFTLALSALALVLGIIISFTITRSVTRPLAAMGAVIETVAHGDLTQRVEIPSKDELGELGRTLNSTNEGLRTMVLQIQNSAQAISSASREISLGNTDLSRRTEEQAASLEETAGSMEQITSNVHQIADNARSANQESAKTRQVAHDGGTAVSLAISAMAAINQSSARINEIIGVVDEIAFQTNLLALNAAVEAARAGEQGRGFAVVAAEVRNLAKRSADAAKEIKNLIRESVARSEDGNKVAAQAGSTIQEVVASVQRVTSLVSEIANATQEQSTGLNEINKAVVQMDEVTQQNAALVEESASAAESMDAQAQALHEIVARFKTGAESRPDLARPAHLRSHSDRERLGLRGRSA
ncbi:MAG: MCP four helix bundle domain-containing protein [Acidobacteria bacterium]|nr:MCP four helix bundle domain-containing protein [Acidobacteriota bacterium]MBI3488640.1 MCP four helix bundle domain-containing protein [Acidobacteriota bacterium]